VAAGKGTSEASATRPRRLLRALLLALIGALYVLSIPWYRSPEEAPAVLFGLPDWVALALGCYVAIAVLNAVAWELTDFSDEAEPRGEAKR
jgi:hypothetical protein